MIHLVFHLSLRQRNGGGCAPSDTLQLKRNHFFMGRSSGWPADKFLAKATREQRSVVERENLRVGQRTHVEKNDEVRV